MEYKKILKKFIINRLIKDENVFCRGLTNVHRSYLKPFLFEINFLVFGSDI